MSDDAAVRRWADEQTLLGLARNTPPSAFALGGMAALAVPPTVRIVVLPGDPASVAVSVQDPKTVIPPQISMPGGGQLPSIGTVRGTSDGYVGYSDPGRGKPWPRFVAVHWHGGVDFYLGQSGGQPADPSRGAHRLIWLRRTVGWAWGAFGFQQKIVRRFGIDGPFRILLGVADTANAGLGDLGTGWADPGGPASPDAPAAVDQQVLLREDVPAWPDAAGVKDLAMRFGARLDIAFGGSGERHLDRTGPEAGRFRSPQF
ncbi:MAG TPA: hypothetical protein VLX31_19385 [Streptosporangiaceae bacterium]|nr:hypothetical protein [Streptosporangiaceae bacterium]